MPVQSRVIVALDFPDVEQTLSFVHRIRPGQCRLKVGFELFVAAGPALLERLTSLGFEIFLDLKFHDIPNTVASAVRAASGHGVWMINVHASGGLAMMLAAREALEGTANRPRLIAVTLLTSLGEDDLQAVGISRPPLDQVRLLAGLARKAGLDGVVCSGREAGVLRSEQGEAFLLVTPGIRPAQAIAADQKRVMTPSQAVAAGADYLVIGRPVTRAEDPAAALQDINSQINTTRTKET